MICVARNSALAAVAFAAIAFAACASDRDRTYEGGAHPDGWSDSASSAFHGDDLRERAYPLGECRQCHGDDLSGGAVEVACSNGACHEQGVDFCGTCHGDESGPLPATGAHVTHQDACAECHEIPTGIDAHPDGAIDLVFGALASADGFDPSWNDSGRTCGGVYCHLGDSPDWDTGAALDCDGCHPTDAIHTRFSLVVSEATCADCHEGSPATGHIDGETRIEVDACDTCHGRGTLGAPPADLSGATDPTVVGVGAHQRHLDRFLDDRIGKATRCDACHDVPADFDSAGHLDQTAPADVDTLGGSYDPATRTCTSWCHMDDAPVWTDDSGAARACDACHGFAPATTQGGAIHPPVSNPTISACRVCHAFTVDSHVDGELTF
jgi:predicted CxxxxCH...CXXCH cytochrome family protein